MEEDHLYRVVPIPSPWRTILLEAVAKVRQRLFIICPYIKEDIVTALKEALLSRRSEAAAPVHVRVLTRVLPEELLNGSSDITALQ
jgi:hypothetical protein